MPAHSPSPGFEERAELFGEKVRRRRDALGLTERELIERTGLSRGYIQLLMNKRGSHKDQTTGRYKLPNPTLDVIWVLAQALEVGVDYLVDPAQPVGPGTP